MVGTLEISVVRLPTCRFEPTSSSSSSSSNAASPEEFLPRRTQNTSARLSFSKPSLIVRTQSNVRIWRRKKPESSCVVCNGSGRVDCGDCYGRGRTNYTNLVILPEGEWPQWCKTCGGSGLGYCHRCLGTGVYRDNIGFRFRNMESNDSQDGTKCQIRKKPVHMTAADWLVSRALPESEIP